MRKNTIYHLKSLYRDDMKVTGYFYGKGEPSVCIMGALRGNEIQQLYTAAKLNKRLKQLERENKILPGKEILVIPTGNNYSINVGRRFWPSDNTDINRMFPGYHQGETTQRVAYGLFESIRHYKYGIHLCSFYMSGDFLPHVRIMHTGYEKQELAGEFGLPYAVIRNPKPYDTTTLNYNWQIWETEAFSVYTTGAEKIDPASADIAIESILRFMASRGIIEYEIKEMPETRVLWENKIETIKSDTAGLFIPYIKAGDSVEKGEYLAEIMDPYTGEILKEITAPKDGLVFFMRNKPIVYSNTVLTRII